MTRKILIGKEIGKAVCKNPCFSKYKSLIKVLEEEEVVSEENVNKLEIENNIVMECIKEGLINKNSLERITKINMHYNNIEDTISYWGKYYTGLDVLIPKEINDEIRKIISESKQYYFRFISTKGSLDEMNVFDEYIIRFEKVKMQIDNFIERNRENKLICDFEILKWLEDNKLLGVKEYIISSGAVINENSIAVIYCREFIEKFREKLEEIFNQLGFTVKNITEDKIYISYMKDKNIVFYMTNEEFMKNYGKCLIGKRETEDIIDKFSLVESKENVNSFINKCNSILSDSIYKFNMENRDGELSKLLTIVKGDTLAKVSSKIFTSNIKRFLPNQKEAEEKIIEFINRISNWNKISA